MENDQNVDNIISNGFQVFENKKDDETKTINNENLPFNEPEFNSHEKDNEETESKIRGNNDEEQKVSNLSESDSDDDSNIKSRTSTFKKLVLFDSDSDSEDSKLHKKADLISSSCNDENSKTSETAELESDNEIQNVTSKKCLKRISKICSDSEDEDVESGNLVDTKETADIYTLATNGDLQLETEKKSKESFGLSNLCDSESSEEDNNSDEDNKYEDEAPVSNIKSAALKRSKKTEEKPEKMTAKKALEQRKEIFSESQKRVRESEISLPYHKPKIRSLKEFLQNRPKFASALPDVNKTLSPSTAIKMSKEELEIVSKKLTERKREVLEFYKSESESDNEHSEDKEEVDPENNQTLDKSAENSEMQKSNCVNSDLKDDNLISEKLEDNLPMELVLEKPVDDVGSQSTSEPLVLQSMEQMDSTEDLKQINIPDDDFSLNQIEVHEKINESKETAMECTDEILQNDNLEGEVPEETSIEINDENHEIIMENSSDDKIVVKKTEINIIANVVIKPSDQENADISKKSRYDLSAEDDNECWGDHEFNLDNIEDENIQTAEKSPDKIDATSKNEASSSLLKKKLAIVQKLGISQPRLSGGPNEIIDLETGSMTKNEILCLKEKFIRHNLKPKNPHKHKVEASVIRINNGEILKEKVVVNADDDNKIEIIEKPGVRLQKLRNELETEITKRRSELWKERISKKDEIDEDDRNENDDKKSYYDDILDDEEEEEITDDEADSIDDDVNKKEYFEDEAEVSDNEDENDAVEEENDEELEEKIDETEESDKDEVAEKKLRRVIKPLDDDDSDEEGYDDDCVIPSQIGKNLINAKIESVNSTQDVMPLGQNVNYKMVQKQVTPVKNDSEFLTPVNNFMGLQDLYNSTSKIAVEDNLELLCSGKFPDTQDMSLKTNDEDNTEATNSSLNLTQNIGTQDLLDICSGKFTLSENDVTRDLQQTKSNNNISTEDFESVNVQKLDKSIESNPNLEENESNLISQLLDEEEMERFKKKFESPITSVTQKSKILEEKEIFHGGGVIDSDDDETEGLKIKKKNRVKITFSDDEDEDEKIDEESIDLQDSDADNVSNIEYDSEENELDENKKKPIKLQDFLENEAELSDEEEEDSGDEDENEDLDVMEMEAGDAEKYDEEELRSDIERVQMRQMLDEDNKEVKLLQELLLDDGEFHGSGRQRQFRWKNMDAVEDNGLDNDNDDNEIFIDEEDEEESQWRKARHEREMFLLQNQTQDESVLDDKMLTFKHKTIIKNQISSINSSSAESQTENIETEFKFKGSFHFANKRGSFLSRSEQILQRYSETSAKISTGKAKNSKKIVFQTVDEEETNKKRKISSNSTPQAIKKIRLSNISQGSKAVNKSSTTKSLFGNL